MVLRRNATFGRLAFVRFYELSLAAWLQHQLPPYWSLLSVTTLQLAKNFFNATTVFILKFLFSFWGWRLGYSLISAISFGESASTFKRRSGSVFEGRRLNHHFCEDTVSPSNSSISFSFSYFFLTNLIDLLAFLT